MCEFFHIPFQSGDNDVLREMKCVSGYPCDTRPDFHEVSADCCSEQICFELHGAFSSSRAQTQEHEKTATSHVAILPARGAHWSLRATFQSGKMHLRHLCTCVLQHNVGVQGLPRAGKGTGTE